MLAPSGCERLITNSWPSFAIWPSYDLVHGALCHEAHVAELMSEWECCGQYFVHDFLETLFSVAQRQIDIGCPAGLRTIQNVVGIKLTKL